MKLLSLHIEKYKNLSGTYDFTSQDGYIALIGENGSGKSNLLEAISLIFGKLYGIPDVQEIGKFWIKYELDGNERIYGNIDEEGNDIQLVQSPQLPSSIISCYSGEDMRLWRSVYLSYYVNFFNKAIGGGSYVPKLLYINKYCWEIALISLLYSENVDVQDFLHKLGIHHEDVKIKFTNKPQNNIQANDASDWYRDVQHTLGFKEILFTDLKEVDLNEKREVYLSPDQRIFYYLYFLSMPEKNENSGLRADKLIEDITITISGINFNNLSEGEKKLILIECITKVLADKNSVLLFDEPDAHTHIARKKDLLEMIEIFNGQTILTTHAPVFVNEIYKREKNNLFFVEKGAFAKSDYINQLITLSSGEIDFLNGSIVLSAKNILVTEGPYDKRYLEKAIEIFCKKDEKYKLLHQVAIIPSNSAGNADAFYEQVLLPQIDKYNKIVFIFDYDEGGHSGWKKIKARREDKLEALFYQQNYSNTLETSNPPSKVNYILVEDFFAAKSYKTKVEEVHLERKKTHKDFRIWTANLSSTIKTYIEGNYSNFADDDYDDFKSILDKLIDIFNL
jgi:ABC-type cobalamin/Fe3+-siderophores transport system ATPase subunit